MLPYFADISSATREEFMHMPAWQIRLFYVLIFASIGVMLFQIWKRSKVWMAGKPISWKPQGLSAFLKYIVGQRKVRSSRRKSGAPMHLLIFYGFLSLFLATTLLAINTYLPWKFHKGVYYVSYELVFDVLGLLFMVGLTWAIFRRYGKRPKAVTHEASDGWALILLWVVGFTGYLLEAARISNTAENAYNHFSPVGYAMAKAMPDVTPGLYIGIWWFHMVWVIAFFALLPQMRIRHIVMAILTAYGSNDQPWGELKPISLEEVEETGQIGVAKAQEYSRWHLMSLDACMECGRCTEVCPANSVGKVLNPKLVVQSIRGVMASENPVADAVTEEALWACTTCNACVEACPVLIRHVDMIVDARRNLVAEGKFSGTGATMLRQLGSTNHAWGAPRGSREEWMQGLDIPLAKDGDFEVLFWVGCAGATDPAAVRTTKAMASLMKKAGVKFACLGNEEVCTGDPARRVGDEFLFQEHAAMNVEAFKRYGVRKVVTACPHCLNTLKNEYHQFEVELEVWHHSQLLAKLVDEGKLKGYKPLAGSTVYHDPCYLARVNNESDAPRKLLGENTQLNDQVYPSSSSSNLLEPEHLGRKTLCCGAGGGRMWMEEPPEQRPGNRRAEELLATGAKTVAIGCPFCRIMLDASIKQVTDEEIKIVDLAEAMQEANA
ncbi:MAG: (Fe-S)-binding protein [Fimbriimonadaceae bacterium]|nr:(Fe-S)-binding protein [Fimbriimonadaceae bacterium]